MVVIVSLFLHLLLPSLASSFTMLVVIVVVIVKPSFINFIDFVSFEVVASRFVIVPETVFLRHNSILLQHCSS